MKLFCIFSSVFLFIGGLFSVIAQDMIILRDGNMLEAKVLEISPTEIRYKRFEHLDGPTIVVPAANVLSIKYENGVLEIINAFPAAEDEKIQTVVSGSVAGPQPGISAPLQIILNAMPAIPIAGNNLKFLFSDGGWTTTVNGENFSAGTIEREDTNNGFMLTLKQTHIWPGAVGRTAGRVANMIPGGSAVGSALNTAGTIAGAVGAIEAAGPVIVLEYREGPPASLRLVSTSQSATASQPATVQAKTDNSTLDREIWKYKVFYLGPTIGIGNVYYLNYYYSYPYGEYEWTNGFLLNYGLVADFNIQPWFSLTTGFNIGIIFDNGSEYSDQMVYFPLMLRFGYKPGRFEFSGNLGFNFGIGLSQENLDFIGFAFGGTLGFAMGRVSAFNLTFSYMPAVISGESEVNMLTFNAGIKFGIGNKRRR